MARILLLLSAIANALWSIFLWVELVITRQGGTAFCSLGENVDCVRVWDSAFASGVHETLGLPIAGFGVLWSLVATAFSAYAIWGKPERRPSVELALRLQALAGIGATIIFFSVSRGTGAICLGCIGSHILVLTFSGFAFFGPKQRPTIKPMLEGGLATVLASGAMYLVLLGPGLLTPISQTQATKNVMAHGSAPTGGDASKAKAILDDMLTKLPPQYRQAISDSLRAHENAPEVPVPTPRAVAGPKSAPVQLTDFTDVLCGHCASLHEALTEMRRAAPDDFSVVSRQFPLDAMCNEVVPQNSGDPKSVRCLGARAQICLETHPKAFEFTSALFRNQRELTVDKIYALAAPYMGREALKKCIDAPDTQSKLEADISYALKHGIRGTPLVLINGRRANAFPPFLYALILTRGHTHHPSFDGLPPPSTEKTQ